MKKKSRNNSTKKILIIILALFIGSFIGYRFALAQAGNALKSVVEPGSMTSEASYVIFTDGTNVYARNGITGEIEWPGTDAVTVIQNAINSLPNGGRVLIKSGTYNLSSRLYVGESNLIIEGESWSTVLRAANNTNLSQVIVVASQSNVTVSDITIDGNFANNPTGGAGLQFYNSPYCYADKIKVINSKDTAIAVGDDDYVINCFVENSDTHGIWGGKRNEIRDNVVKNVRAYGIQCSDYSKIIGNYVEGTSWPPIRPVNNAIGIIITDNIVNNSGDDGFDLYNQTDLVVTDNTIYNSTDTGIIVYGGRNVVVRGNICKGSGSGGFGGIATTSYAATGLPGPEQVIIEGNIVYDNYLNGIEVKNSTNVIVKGNMVFDNSQNPVQTSVGIYVSASDSVLVEGNRVFDDQGTKTQKYGIWLGENPTNVTIFNNDIRGNMYAMDGYNFSGITKTIRSNIGYVTENSGNATVSNNDWIAHGLATTPSVVTLTPRSNATVWVNNRNATHFQVGVSSGTVMVDWHAEV